MDSKMRRALWKASIGVVLITTIAIAWYLLPVREWADVIQRTVKEWGVAGLLLFIALYVAATLILFPSSVLSVLAGFVFGLWGIPVVIFSATCGAVLAFSISRHMLRAKIASLIVNYPKFRAVDQAVGIDGWKIVALFRLSPLVPFNLQNYLFGTTKVRLAHFAYATMISIVPGTFLSVQLGAAVGSEARVSALQWTLRGIGVLTTIAAIYFVNKRAQAMLERGTAPDCTPSAQAD